jgi:hypothetical protein
VSLSLYIAAAGFFGFYFLATFSLCKSFIFMFLIKFSIFVLVMRG